MIELRVFGSTQLRAPDGRDVQSILSHPKRFALLAYLAAARPREFQRRDALLALFWPELDQAHARNALRQALHFLRAALGREGLVSRGEDEVGINPEHLWCDVAEFERRLDAGEWRPALELYRGDLLAAFHLSDVPEFERWLDQERDYLRQRAVHAALALARNEERLGGPLRGARWAARALQISPYDEVVLRELLRLLDQAGDRAEAIHQYELFARRLEADLGVDPDPETTALTEAIRARAAPWSGTAEAPAIPTPGTAGSLPTGSPNHESSTGKESEGTGEGPSPRRRKRVAVLALIVVLLATAYLYQLGFSPDPPSATGRIMLAVLPFENLTGDGQQEYLSDGLTDDMITQLGRLDPDRLGVIARTSAMQYRNTRKHTGQIGSELGVDYLLEGSVRRLGERVLVSVHLIRVRDQTQVWAERYERDLRDILALESDVTRAVAREIDLELTSQQQARMARVRSLDPQSHEFYLKGRFFWNKRSEDGFTRAIHYFDQAIARDPGYAQAYAGLADAYALLSAIPNRLVSRREGMSRARQAALAALALDDNLAEAHTSLAFVRMHFDWDWPGAQSEFKRAIELNPGYATARHWYAYWLIAQGRADEAIREIRLAQQLDPLSLIISADVAEILLFARRYDEAIEQARKTLEMDPGFPLARRILGAAYVQKRRFAPALQELEGAARISGGRKDVLCSLGHAYAAADQREEAQRLLDRIACAPILAALGQKDRALASLENEYQAREGGLILLKVEPGYDPLRSDPRFQDLVRRVLGSS